MKEITGPGQLFDLCHEMFGIGGYDETGDEPFYKVRMREIAKIKGFVNKRGLEYKTLGITAHYCYQHGIRIEGTGGLVHHIAPALVQMREAKTRAVRAGYEHRVQHAIETALEQGLPATAEQLMRMPMAGSQATLEFIEQALGIAP